LVGGGLYAAAYEADDEDGAGQTCRKVLGDGKRFQRGFAERIVRVSMGEKKNGVHGSSSEWRVAGS